MLLCSLFCPFGVKKKKHFATVTVIGPFDLCVSGCNAIGVREQSNLMSEGAPAKQRDRASTLSCCLWMTGIYIGSKSVNQTIVTHSYFLFGDGPTPTQHTPSLLCSTAEGLVPLTREPRSGQHLQPHSRREQITTQHWSKSNDRPRRGVVHSSSTSSH